VLRLLLHPRTLFGVALGVGVAYLLDPDRGRSRRARLRDQAFAKARRAERDVRRKASFAEGRLEGRLHRVTSKPSMPEGRELADKVRSRVLDDDRWKGEVVIDAVGHVVTLRGQLPSENLIHELEARVQAVDGVERIESFLHTPDTPAPNKAKALHAAEVRGETAPSRSYG
jgi:osmotically-inducible protein OsmY